MQLQQASRKKAKIKMALLGPSGSGKSMSALLAAYGLTNNWCKVAVIDTENHSAELYSHLGHYNVVNIAAPYTPEKYIDAIKLCEQSQMEVIILDSISHEWEGSGGILDIHSNMAGNSFTNWGKITPRHNAFIQAMLQSHCHIIGTIRSKQDYVLNEKNGKMIPEKVGLKGVTREGMDYEFTLVFDLDIKNNVTTSKDRTGLFTGKPEFKISPDTGKLIAEWCNSGEDIQQENIPINQLINECKTLQELILLYNTQLPSIQKDHVSAFAFRKSQLVQPIS